MRIGLAGCFHESNTFAPGLTHLSAFQNEWVLNREAFDSLYKQTRTSVGGVIDFAEQEGFELVPIFFTRAIPSGTVAADAMEEISSVLLQQLDKEANALDGLVLVLHGAMVSEKVEDVEG